MTAEGQGLGRSNGLAVFVKGAVIGDRVEAELTKVKKNYAFGRLIEVASPSAERIDPFCQYFGQCGGCAYGQLSYKAQLAVKEKQVRDKLIRLGGVQLDRAGETGKPDAGEKLGIDGELELDGDPESEGKAGLSEDAGLDRNLGIDGNLGPDESAEMETEAKLDGALGVEENLGMDGNPGSSDMSAPRLMPIIGMEEPYRYRNKASMPVWTGGIITRKGGVMENLGEPTIGFYQAKSHDVVDCYDCFLQSEPAMAAAEALRQFMISDNITAYDPKWEKGLLRHLVVKTARGTGEVMVILVINGKGIPNAEKLVEMLDDAIYNLSPTEDGVEYNLESVIVNVNKAEGKAGTSKGAATTKKPGKGQKSGSNGKAGKSKGNAACERSSAGRGSLTVENVQKNNEASRRSNNQSSQNIFGQECITVAGKPTILEEVGGLRFEISPLSFYQVNPVQMEVLYDKAMEYADLSGDETVLDLYCGVGTIGLFAAAEMNRKQQERVAVSDDVLASNVAVDLDRNIAMEADSLDVNDDALLSRELSLDGDSLDEKDIDLDGQLGLAGNILNEESHLGLNGNILNEDSHLGAMENLGLASNDREAIDAVDEEGIISSLSDLVENRRSPMNAGRVIGIESVKEAVLDANRNAVINGIVNARYVCGKAEEELPKLISGEGLKDESLKIDHADVVFLDPPRAGCDERLLSAVVGVEPERIVYVSCDPATLARDVKYLTGNGYSFVEGTPADMFPWTGHVETVCLMTRKEK